MIYEVFENVGILMESFKGFDIVVFVVLFVCDYDCMGYKDLDILFGVLRVL